jgi:hypothetical protein
MMGPMPLRKFETLVKSFGCRVERCTKEWEIRDSNDGKRVMGFATVSGRYVKRWYVDEFLKLIAVKRGGQK